MRTSAWMKWAAFAVVPILVLLPLAGCGDDADKSNGPPPPPKAAPAPTAAGPAGGAGAATASAPARGVSPATEAVLVEARKRSLSKEDFTEADNNRDPFRSFLSSFAVQQVVKPGHKIVLEKFSIEELKLAGIITGELQPRAMFIDPSGQGVSVIRGDHMSKADAVVTRIAPDRVYLRIEEGGGSDNKPVVTERVVDLHAGELSQQ